MNVGKKLCLLCCFILVAAILLAGCIGQEKTIPKKVVISDPKEYFPMTGTWSYKIDSGTTDALLYRAMDNNRIVNILRSPIKLQGSEGYYLKIKTAIYAHSKTGTELSSLDIIRDDLGIFKGASRFYWMISEKNSFMVDQLIYYPEGISPKAIFFLPPFGEEGEVLNNLVDGEEKITYIGTDDKPPGCREQACMYFIREVKPGSGAYGYADKGFIEHQWFAKGKGLILLKQEIDGKSSMTWTLQQYIPT